METNIHPTISYAMEQIQNGFIQSGEKITSSSECYKLAKPYFDKFMTDHEEFWVLYMSQSNHPKAFIKLGQGGITGTVADIRLILRYAILLSSPSFICFHNHPSGNLKPSDADIRLTNKLSKSAEIMDMTLLDHLIMTEDNFYSLSDNGRII